jgi:hypothetical protein
MGEKLTPANVLAVVQDYRQRGYRITRKLNGDRVVLSVNGSLQWWSRYGQPYSFNVNPAPWQDLPDGTLLDGEAYRGEFYPFLDVNQPTIGQGEDSARRITLEAGMPWIYGDITTEWLLQEARSGEKMTTRKFEGCVAKLANSPYLPLRRPDMESATWTKLKW